ncbi:MAG: YceI family protein [Bacteroidota bacterium]|nr:YceI family protein [Bacteroidota bacterium]MDX5429953.1 YceI family protein [Bacteroidota bacterium]MDX5468726.1 YceI family protein [Bacteroidota bacterium]
MKKIILLAAVAVFLAACGDSKKTAEATQDVANAGTEAITYTVDAASSTVKWSGAKKMDVKHHGTVQLTSGSLSFEGENLVAGNFTVDMNTIADEDLTEETGQSKLVGHLKSADFFMVESFPSAKFEITSVEKLENSAEGTHTIKGNLTIKDQTHGISFPATITKTDAGVNAVAKFDINRNEWGIVWGGSQETNQGVLDFLKDNLLQDMIGFEINLTAKP